MAPFMNPSPTRYAFNSAADALRRMMDGAQAYGEQHESYRGPSDFGMSAQYGGANPNMTQVIAQKAGSLLDSYEDNMGGLDLQGHGGSQAFTPNFNPATLPPMATSAVVQDNLLRPGTGGTIARMPLEQSSGPPSSPEQMIQLLNSAPAPRDREQLSGDAARMGLPQPVSTFGYGGGDQGAVAEATDAARQRWQRQTGTLYQGDPGMNIMGVPDQVAMDNNPFGMEGQGAEYADQQRRMREYARMSSARQPAGDDFSMRQVTQDTPPRPEAMPGNIGQLPAGPISQFTGAGGNAAPARAQLLAQMNDATGVGQPNNRAIISPERQAELDQRKENVRLRQMGKGYGMHPLGLQNYEDKRQIMLNGLNGDGINPMQLQALGLPPQLIQSMLAQETARQQMQMQNQQFGQEQQRLGIGTQAEAAEKQAAAAVMKQRMETIAAMTPQQQMQMLMNGNAPADAPMSNEQKLEKIWTSNKGDFSAVPFAFEGNENDFLGYTRPQAIPDDVATEYYNRLRSNSQSQSPMDTILQMLGVPASVPQAFRRNQ